MVYTEGQSVGLSLLLGRHGACGYEWQSLRAGIGQQAIPSIGIAAQGRSPPAHSLIASNPTRCVVQGRTKQFLLSSATHVLSGLVGCALAAWVAGNRREGKFKHAGFFSHSPVVLVCTPFPAGDKNSRYRREGGFCCKRSSPYGETP